ncbi:hypothetical protein LLEC1_01417 [Akanthomyces lecanii]|uniref:U4/U6.U5 small nuclear ribonucleoprotein 27kDa protein domain-containing protein n=1 Tax=Cordyceps confragosa TaxID=2714763 RepID=A0A179I1Q9_CORDF|nr:hypothetical protein LLEC1_01417 [Akanthomyces lecanii]
MPLTPADGGGPGDWEKKLEPSIDFGSPTSRSLNRRPSIQVSHAPESSLLPPEKTQQDPAPKIAIGGRGGRGGNDRRGGDRDYNSRRHDDHHRRRDYDDSDDYDRRGGRDRRRRSPSRSRSPPPRDGDRMDQDPKPAAATKNKKPATAAVPIIGQDGGDDDEDMAAMQAMMGFGGFGTTKDKRVAGNNAGAVRKEKKTEYRQYMNRLGGFNRALSPTRD